MRATVQVGEIAAPSGGVATGFLHIGELADGCSPIQIPVMVVNGVRDGPMVYLHSGSHGQEPTYAIELMRLLREELAPERLSGAVVMVPVANLLAYQAATRISPLYGVREGVPFGGDLHKLWPGDSAGSITQRLANAIWTRIVAQADCVVDFHTNSWPGFGHVLMYQPVVGSEGGPGGEVWRRSLEVARTFGLTVILGAANPATLAGAAMGVGKAGITVELPTPRIADPQWVRVAARGTRNVLAYLGVIEDEVAPQTEVPVLSGLYRNLPSIRANRGGVIHYEVRPGEFVAAGVVIARIFDVLGNELGVVRMAQDGYISTFPPLSWVGAQGVASGDYVADCFASEPSA